MNNYSNFRKIMVSLYTEYNQRKTCFLGIEILGIYLKYTGTTNIINIHSLIKKIFIEIYIKTYKKNVGILAKM